MKKNICFFALSSLLLSSTQSTDYSDSQSHNSIDLKDRMTENQIKTVKKSFRDFNNAYSGRSEENFTLKKNIIFQGFDVGSGDKLYFYTQSVCSDLGKYWDKEKLLHPPIYGNIFVFTDDKTDIFYSNLRNFILADLIKYDACKNNRCHAENIANHFVQLNKKRIVQCSSQDFREIFEDKTIYEMDLPTIRCEELNRLNELHEIFLDQFFFSDRQ